MIEGKQSRYGVGVVRRQGRCEGKQAITRVEDICPLKGNSDAGQISVKTTDNRARRLAGACREDVSTRGKEEQELRTKITAEALYGC